MSESDGPKRRRKKSEEPQGERSDKGGSPDNSVPSEASPVSNPWHNPAEESAQRRSARMDDVLRQRAATARSRAGGKAMWALGAIGIVTAWLISTSLHVLAANEQGVVTTLGRYSGTASAGLNLTLPWPLQQVTTRATGQEQVLMLPAQEAETLMLTRDGELIDIRALVRWRISDLRAFTFAVPDGDATLQRLSDSAIRAGVAEFTFDELRDGRRQAELQQRIVGRLQRVLDAWKLGIAVGGVELTAANPPAPIHQEMAPPMVLPAVATNTAGQNRSGLSWTKPKTAGSEPMGSSVADINATTNTVVRPTSGKAKVCRNDIIQVSMRTSVAPGVCGGGG